MRTQMIPNNDTDWHFTEWNNTDCIGNDQKYNGIERSQQYSYRTSINIPASIFSQDGITVGLLLVKCNCITEYQGCGTMYHK